MSERQMSDWMLGDLGRSTRVRVLLLGTLGTGLMIGIIVLTFTLMREYLVKSDQLARMQEVTVDVDELSQLAVDLETGQRGFLLTGESAYLQPFERAREQLPALLTRIDATLPPDPSVRAQFELIRTQLDAKQQDIEMSVDIANKEGMPHALEFFRTNFGKTIMDEIRVLKRSLARSLRDYEGRLRGEIEELRFERELSIASLAALGTIAAIAAFAVLMGYVRALETERSARREAERSASESREKSNFLANMSHEIRTPMNAIFGFAQLLGDLVKGEREQYYVRAIAQSGKSLLALINDILDMSKIEAGKLDLHLEPIDLRELVSGVATIFSQMAMEKGIKLQMRVAADMPSALLLDPLRVRQLLFNLVGNAIKYTDRGSVKFHACLGPATGGDEKHTLVLEVADTGIGIPAADIEHIFEPFTQASAAGQQPRAGTGLGLSIVKRLVELMGGEVQVESTLGRGSLFRVLIAQVSVAASPPSSSGRAPEVRLSELPPLRIVVIDDVELNRSLIEGLFAGTHHRIYTASDGATGVALVRREIPDFVLMDVCMPGMDGVEALRLIRAEPALGKVRVIAVTASSLLGEEGMRSLFDGYVRKPIAREALFEVLGGVREGASAVSRRVFPNLPAFAQLSATTRTALSALRPQLQSAAAHAVATLSTDEVQALLLDLGRLPRVSELDELRALGQAVEEAVTVFDLAALEARLGELVAFIGSCTDANEHS